MRPAVALLLIEKEPAVERSTAPDGGTAHVDAYAGAQKVVESDGAIAIELAVRDRWLRLGGSLVRYYERQASGSILTLTMPALTLGAKISDSDTTRVYLEAGAVYAKTHNDPVMDTSISGVLGGVHVEHELSPRTSIIGDASVMAFQADVRAAAVRAGVRYRMVQLSVRMLDFNVGPALYGPELGLGF